MHYALTLWVIQKVWANAPYREQFPSLPLLPSGTYTGCPRLKIRVWKKASLWKVRAVEGRTQGQENGERGRMGRMRWGSFDRDGRENGSGSEAGRDGCRQSLMRGPMRLASTIHCLPAHPFCLPILTGANGPPKIIFMELIVAYTLPYTN